MSDLTHLLVFIKRRLGNGRGTPRSIGTFNEFSLTRPAGHGFGQRWLYKLHQNGTPLVIWLFSILRYKDVCLPPSLDARIQVETRHHACSELGASQSQIEYAGWLLSKYRYAFEAHIPGSFYLPWNDCTPELLKLFPSIKLSAEESAVVPFERYSDFVTHFQTPRMLSHEAGRTLERFAKRLLLMPRGFISYRRAEAPVLAMQVAASLFRFGVAPWWDQWAMPRTVAEENALLQNKEVLSNALDQAIQNAQYAVTIHTQSYGTPISPYTEHEFNRITAAEKQGSLTLIRIKAAHVMGMSRDEVDDALRVFGLG